MNVKVPGGKYVLAVSGGVDSVALLDILSRQKNLELVVAHFNHGIRDDSLEDEELVASLAKKYGMYFVTEKAKLGSKASEATARDARYEFLRAAKRIHGAVKIITAHHQDDLIETTVLNILRGTGRRGLSAISSNPEVHRPMLGIPKTEIIDYAKKHNLVWREDSTNEEDNYLRNYIRSHLLIGISPNDRQILLKNTHKVAKNNLEADDIIATLSHIIYNGKNINRDVFISLPFDIEKEILIYWLHENGVVLQSRSEIDRLVNVLKTANINTSHNVQKKYRLVIGKKEAHLTTL